MSLEAAKSFVKRMETDENFRKKVIECKDSVTRKEFVIKEGFDFTEDDLNMVKRELSDEELKYISGGSGNQGDCYGGFATFLPK